MERSKDRCQDDETCERSGKFLCDHCSLIICLQHLLEHNELKVGRLNELIDQIEEFQQNIDGLSIENTISKAQNDLECWKNRAIEHINKTYEFSKKKLEQYENEINDRISGYKTHWQLQLDFLSDRANRYQTDNEVSASDLKSIEKELEELQSGIQSLKYDFHIETYDIEIEDLIKNRPTFSYKRLNSSHQITKSYRKLSMNQMKIFVTCDRCETILWLDEENHLFVFDRISGHQPIELPNIGVEPSLRKIIDMKWCPGRNQFLILSPISIYSLNPKTKDLVELFIDRYENLPFHCFCTLSDGSLMISYDTMGICVEHWKNSPRSDRQQNDHQLILRWDWREKQDKLCIASMTSNQIDQLGIIISCGVFKYFEIRDKSFEKIIRSPIHTDSIDSIYPFGEMIWYLKLKDTSNQYHRYFKDEDRLEKVEFKYPCGLQQCGEHSVIVGVSNTDLQFCDFI